MSILEEYSVTFKQYAAIQCNILKLLNLKDVQEVLEEINKLERKKLKLHMQLIRIESAIEQLPIDLKFVVQARYPIILKTWNDIEFEYNNQIKLTPPVGLRNLYKKLNKANYLIKLYLDPIAEEGA